VFGVAWQKRDTPPMVAELWSSLPEPRAPAPPPAPKVEPKPVPKVELKPVPKPVPKVEPKPVPKAEITLREKKEKERKAKEKELAEKKKREEQARLEALKRQQEKERAEQLAREQDEALRKIAQAEAQAREVDKFKRLIADKIRQKIVEPPGLKGNPEVEFDVVVIPGGDVLHVTLRRTSGQATWDTAVERAIRGAQPLPLPPPESGLMREFRELNLKFRPKE
jgi:colicin import membrane protein